MARHCQATTHDITRSSGASREVLTCRFFVMLVITVVEFTNHNKDDAQCIVDNFIVIYWEI